MNSISNKHGSPQDVSTCVVVNMWRLRCFWSVTWCVWGSDRPTHTLIFSDSLKEPVKGCVHNPTLSCCGLYIQHIVDLSPHTLLVCLFIYVGTPLCLLTVFSLGVFSWLFLLENISYFPHAVMLSQPFLVRLRLLNEMRVLGYCIVWLKLQRVCQQLRSPRVTLLKFNMSAVRFLE